LLIFIGMGQALEFFQKLFDTSDFPPRWHCGRWSEFHGWLYIISDLAIWAAYFAIPLLIVRYITRRHNQRFIKLYFLFAGFILACGSTHLLDALSFWVPVYRFSALVRLGTAIVSWLTVFNLFKVLPAAFSLKTASELEYEVEQRKKAEEQLRVNNAMLSEALQIAKLGHWQWNVVENKVTWTDSILRLYGEKGKNLEMTYEQYLHRVHPDDREYVHNIITQALDNKTLPMFYHRSILPDGRIRVILGRGEVVTDEQGRVIKMVGTAQDVTDQKTVEQELLIKTQRLEATNTELQKFAYVASHDLREPLRKIITFGTMLEREYSKKLEEKGTLYVHKMTGSALRMQKLIDDILNFSKLAVNELPHTKVKLNNVVAHVLSDMEITINSTGAKIVVDDLPEIQGNSSQLGQLFQNLLSNAIKFRKPETSPEIHIHAQVLPASSVPDHLMKSDHYRFSIMSDIYNEQELFCKIYVEDNGIGFDQSYIDKIFLIFQRLHDKNIFEGTGIGLAICKKVADLHNGFITANSRAGEGTTFIIILPLQQPALHTNATVENTADNQFTAAPYDLN
jgi:PAS domain S-box-containing protein